MAALVNQDGKDWNGMLVGPIAYISAKSHFRIYPHNLQFNPDYPENASNSK